MPPFIRVGPGPRGHLVDGPGFFMGHPLLGGLVALLVIGLFVALAVVAIAVLVRTGRPGAVRRPATSPSAAPSALDGALRILDERFARGEIDASEYTERRELLKQSA